MASNPVWHYVRIRHECGSDEIPEGTLYNDKGEILLAGECSQCQKTWEMKFRSFEDLMRFVFEKLDPLNQLRLLEDV